MLQSDCILDKVFKNGPSETCGRQPLKNMKRYGLLIPYPLSSYPFKYFKRCLPQILLGPFLNALALMYVYVNK